MCYLIAKDLEISGCYAWKTHHGEELTTLVENLDRQVADESRALKGLLGALEKGEASAREKGWISSKDVRKALGV